MDETLIKKLQLIERRYEELNNLLAHPETLGDTTLMQRYGREHADLSEIISHYRAWLAVERHRSETSGLLSESDEEIRALAREEMAALDAQSAELEQAIRVDLLPKDIMDDHDAFVTIQAGAGGDEAGLFAAELLRMYLRYAERHRWTAEIIDSNESGIGGYKEVVMQVHGKGAYARLKYEGGTHRVQRVPATEANGRIHTSTAKVIVLPEAEDIDVQINEEDLRIDVFRSHGHGGQGVNTTDSAVRITHLPTGIVVSCQNERSQIQNRASAMAVLQAKLLERRREEDQAKMNALKDGGTSWGNQMRSYVLHPYQMVKDLRTEHEVGNPAAVLDGDIDDFIEAGIRWRRSA